MKRAVPPPHPSRQDRARALGRAAALAATLALAGCLGGGAAVRTVSGPEGERPAAAAPAGPGPAPADAPSSPDRRTPYWVLYATWRSDHRDLLRKLDDPALAPGEVDASFRRAAGALIALGDRRGPDGREAAGGIAERYDALRRDAQGEGLPHRIRERVVRLGEEVSRGFSEEPGGGPETVPASAGPIIEEGDYRPSS